MARINSEIETYIHDFNLRTAANRVRFRGRVIPLRAGDTLLTYERLTRRQRRDFSSLRVAVGCLAIFAAVGWYWWVTS